jgi:subtilase family serine protease
VTYPGSDPSLVAVGGTSLHLDANNQIASETAWSESGGGRDTTLPRAPWQTAVGMPADGARWAPDVAFDADLNTGIRFRLAGEWHLAGGTSIGAPAWAAAWALIRESAANAGMSAGAAAPVLYRLGNGPDAAQLFHDVTSGSNGAYSAHVGWDAVTGWGTPNVAELARAVASNPSP